MNFKIFTASALLVACALSATAGTNYPTCKEIKSIPLPPAGKRWIVNEQFSDEFNGTELDQTKWIDHHPTWKGRYPALFKPENVSMRDGYLRLKGSVLDKPEPIKYNDSLANFYAGGAAVVSRTQEAHFGYYECSFKANQLTLSSTFWFSTRGKQASTEGTQPKGAPAGRFSQELDVCECVGKVGDYSGKFFSQGMNSNIHYWFSPTEGKRQDVRVKDVRLKIEDGSLPRDGFNTYGVWWRDEENASFYLNNGQESHRNFIGKAQGKSWKEPYDHKFRFTQTMGMNLVVETYPYPWIPLPTLDELRDDTRNTTLYDWVRAYLLVDVKASNKGAKSMFMFEDLINVRASESEKNISIRYTAEGDRQIEITVFDSKGKKIATESISALAGYANLDIVVSKIAKVKKGESYTVVASLKKGGKTIVADSFKFEN